MSETTGYETDESLNKPRRKTRSRKRHSRKRSFFVLDSETLKDLDAIQYASRASSATEAVRTAIRRYAKMTRLAEDGYEIQAVAKNESTGSEERIIIDVPGGG